MSVRALHDRHGYVYRREEFFGRGRFPIAVIKDVTHATRVAKHRHEFSELVIVTGGSCLHVYGQHRWPIRRGDVFVLLDSRLHGYEQPSDLRIINVLYDPNRLPMPPVDIGDVPGYHALFTLEPAYRERRGLASRMRLPLRELGQAQDIVGNLDRELGAHHAGFGFAATALFMQLVVHLSRCYESSPHAESGRILLRLGAAVSHLERNYADPLTVEKLGAVAGLSRRHFQRLFREAMGASPIDYLLKLRVRKAAEILSSGAAGSIAAVAYGVGFEDPNYFSRTFRSQMGVTPREYAGLKA